MPGATRHPPQRRRDSPSTTVLTLLIYNTYGTERTALRIPDANLPSIFSQFYKTIWFLPSYWCPRVPRVVDINIYNVNPPCCYYECTNDTVYELHTLDTLRPLIHTFIRSYTYLHYHGINLFAILAARVLEKKAPRKFPVCFPDKKCMLCAYTHAVLITTPSSYLTTHNPHQRCAAKGRGGTKNQPTLLTKLEIFPVSSYSGTLTPYAAEYPLLL
ncbi:hypothetical protein PABG_12602 [Paracoccidioides brasiliensis Pb03]|nr:hypothetical protein PABG_12602 [Paracoccidioides brasiliensis Pb03]